MDCGLWSDDAWYVVCAKQQRLAARQVANTMFRFEIFWLEVKKFCEIGT
jgi:hypothetical protein